MPASIAWWPLGEGRRLSLRSQSESGWKWIIGVTRNWLRFGVAFNRSKALGYRERKDFLRREAEKRNIWPYTGFCRLLLCQDRAPRNGAAKPPLLMPGFGHICGAGPCTCIALLSSPSSRGNYTGQGSHLASGASSFHSGKQGPGPQPKTGIWSQDRPWWALVRIPSSEALNRDWNLSEHISVGDWRMLRATLSGRNPACLVQLARRKEEVKYASYE